MKRIIDIMQGEMKKVFGACLVFSFIGVSNAFATSAEEFNPADRGCMEITYFLGVVLIVAIIVNLSLVIWVAKDAKARGCGVVGWVIAFLLFGLIALIIYKCSRPSGNLVKCFNCGKKKLNSMRICPYCHAEKD
ncbi:MAG: hypothetical protein WCP79_08135 [Bacillota bacterium]